MNRRLLLVVLLLLVLAGGGGGYYYITNIMSQPMVSVPETPPPAPLAAAAPAPGTDPLAAAPTDEFAIVAPPQPETTVNAATDVTVPATVSGTDVGAMAPPPSDVTVPLEQAPVTPDVAAVPENGVVGVPPATEPVVPAAPETPAAATPEQGVPMDPAVAAGMDQLPPPPPEEMLAVAPDVAPAEAAIVQNAPVLDTVAPPVAAGQPNMGEPMPAPVPQPQTAATANVGAAGGTLESAGTGPKVTEILSVPANIRPLPNSYLVVKKDRGGEDKKSQLTAARAALMQGRDQAALEIFNTLYEESPRDKKVLMGRAVAMQRLGQSEAAVSAYEEVLRNDPKNVEALTNMLGLMRQQDPHLALEKLQQLQDIYPSNADVAAQLGTAYGMVGKYDDALKYLDMANALKPGRASILYNQAIVYDRMGRAGEAATLYRDLIRMHADGTLDESIPVESIKRRLASIR